jgi:hypothetical protein
MAGLPDAQNPKLWTHLRAVEELLEDSFSSELKNSLFDDSEMLLDWVRHAIETASSPDRICYAFEGECGRMEVVGTESEDDCSRRVSRAVAISNVKLHCGLFPVTSESELKHVVDAVERSVARLVFDAVVSPILFAYPNRNHIWLPEGDGIEAFVEFLTDETDGWIDDAGCADILKYRIGVDGLRRSHTAGLVLRAAFFPPLHISFYRALLDRAQPASVRVRLTKWNDNFGNDGLSLLMRHRLSLSLVSWAREQFDKAPPERRDLEPDLVEFVLSVSLTPGVFVTLSPSIRSQLLAQFHGKVALQNNTQEGNPLPQYRVSDLAKPPTWVQKCIDAGLARPCDDGSGFVWLGTLSQLKILKTTYLADVTYPHLATIFLFIQRGNRTQVPLASERIRKASSGKFVLPKRLQDAFETKP